MHKHIVWGILGCVAGLLIGIFAVSTSTPSQMTESKEVYESNMHESMMESTKMLDDLEGVEFDRIFLYEMIEHHEGAIDMAQLVLRKSQRPELQNLANNIIVTQTNEITQMERWLNEWTK